MAVVGKREVEGHVVAVRRRRDGKQYNSTVPELVEDIAACTKGYPSMPLKLPVLVSQRPGYKQIG
jgi:threonyl-tRNA synthetase